MTTADFPRALVSVRDQGRYRNHTGKETLSLADGLAMVPQFVKKRPGRTPPGPLPLLSPLQTWRAPPTTGLRITWLGHSTLLLEIDGARILTDPVWAERASPSQRFGPKRFHPPPVRLAELPPLDLVLLSHDHYDHLDAVAVRAIALAQPFVPFFVPLGVGSHLARFGVPESRITELDWWTDARVRTEDGGDVVITSTPAQHFSGRGPLDRNSTLWTSYVVRGPEHALFFSGDTGLDPAFPAIAAHHGPFDVVMLEVGAFHPAWGDIHLGPHQAMTAREQLGGAPLLPIHWGTFDLGLHPWDEPILVLEEAARNGALPLVTPRLGGPLELGVKDDLLARMDAWWREVR